MHRIIEIVNKCNKQGIFFNVNENELLIKTEKGKITKEILSIIKDNKQEIISFFKKKFSPLSFSQERLWFIDQYEHNNAYNIPIAYRIFGELDFILFEKVFLEIIRRHEILRTNFILIDNIPQQVIHEDTKFKLENIDLSKLSKDESEKKAKEYLKKEFQKTFNLSEDCLIRTILYKITEREYILFLDLHHIISDFWSYSILLKEISILYKSFIDNAPSPLAELPIQYADYAIWQREYLKGERLQKQLDYWKIQLENVTVLELPTDKKRPNVRTYNGNSLPLKLNKKITQKLNNLCIENNTTLFMILLSAFKILLHKYSGQNDICVGSPIANRTTHEVEGLIGFFANTLVLRSIVEEKMSFLKFLKEVKITTLEAYQNQDLPFEKVVEIVGQERNLSYSPLFQVSMILQNTPEIETEFSDLDFKLVEFNNNTSKFDLTLDFIEAKDGLLCKIEYNTDLFHQATIDRMIGHFTTLVEKVIEDPNTQIKDLQILTPAEKQQLLVEWNNTTVDYPKDKCIHQLFEEQVEKTPNKVAVIFEKDELTYKQLNEKTNKLGHYLQEKGVKAETLLGICVERSLDMIVGLLGILKAGGAYVPIDPGYPKDRISYMLEDAACEIVLTQEHLEIPETNSMIIYLDSDWDKIENEPAKNVKSEVKSDNLVYVIYTSGSTGKPKGTLIEHRALINRLDWMQRNYPIGEKDTLLQKTTYTFDVSVWELFWWSLYGAKLCILKPGGEKEPETIVEAIESNKITTIHFVPSMYDVFLEYLNYTNTIEKIESLKQLFTSGEALTSTHVAKSEKILIQNSKSLINLYGPTEATIDVSYYNCSVSDKLVPIGKPISNIQLYIADKHSNLVPVGVPGELCISGDGLARGYLKRPELTSEKFIKNPYSDEPNSRLYKTGDLARYLPDGNIEFLGRIDNQVKIRGFRIELGEIESALNNLETISSSVVLAKEDKSGNKRLVAYIVSVDEINVKEIRKGLSKSLPDYMIPSLFVSLEKMPLTPNGKVNRKALPDPEGNIEKTNEYVAPRNETEQKLAVIWSKVLGVEKVGVYDNFFELGGHSLLATQLISKIKTEFNCELSLKGMFENSNIATLVEQIVSNKSTNKIERIQKFNSFQGEIEPDFSNNIEEIEY